MTGSNWLEQIIPAGERDPWRALLLSKSLDTQHLSSHFEGTILTRNTAPRLIAWNTTILRNEEGQFAGVAAIGSDITDQRA